MNPQWQWRHIWIYVAMLAVFMSLGTGLIVASGKLFGANGLYPRMLMWSPAMAAVATALISRHSIADFGWRWGEWRWQIQAWLVPLFYAGISYTLIWMAGWGGFPNQEFITKTAESVSLPISANAATALYVLMMGTLGAVAFQAALGEEIGWRGFLVPALYETTKGNFTATALISGTIWGLWHAPIIFLSTYNNPGVPRSYSFACFFMMIIASATIDAWYRLRSGSLWTAVFLHQSHNLWVQQIFTPLTVNTGKTNYFIDEFGIVLPLVMALFAIYFWRRRGELSSVHTREAAVAR